MRCDAMRCDAIRYETILHSPLISSLNCHPLQRSNQPLQPTSLDCIEQQMQYEINTHNTTKPNNQHTHSVGSVVDVVPVKRALVSVSDKTGIVEFCTALQKNYGTELLSTGGTAKKLRESGLVVLDVAEFTGGAECLDGRVKTLHPKIHGGLLAVRGNAKHDADMKAQGMSNIDMTILNLYPFEETMKRENVTFEQCVENIDIGGPSMMRSTAKNHNATTIVTNPNQYGALIEELAQHNGGTTLKTRKSCAAKAFALSAKYDGMIASYFSEQIQKDNEEEAEVSAEDVFVKDVVHPRVYSSEFKLKYGCNPHQKPAAILSRMGEKLPFEVLNGTPGYINLLDAANAWQLVKELRQATGLAAAASFKHVSPAGAAVAVPLTDVECLAYEVPETDRANLTDVSLAYLRARNADPMCSFGDFSAVSDVVDEQTALYLKKCVSDGIVAPGYTPEALAILKSKKGGRFIVLEATKDYDSGPVEFREVYGMTFMQRRNETVLTSQHMSTVVTDQTKCAPVNEAAVRDLIVASICVKYTQSNSVGFSKDGMMVGVGAGQQSRVDCVKLAGRKVQTWYLRQHPKVLALPFKEGVKRQDRVNARVRYIEGDFTDEEKIRWNDMFSVVPEALAEDEKQAFLADSSGIAISSDAFFPFRDSIDHCSKLGVSYVAQPGGSVLDGQVTEACNDYGIAMCHTGVRLFHH
uniref:MGS-like domain-containing protein n=1 Tax=Pseudo-nitzschia australis TaxID=44445 RepID=A0A7S4AG84_9STRA